MASFLNALGRILVASVSPWIASNSAFAQTDAVLCDYLVSCAGDVDNDGTSDFLIARSGYPPTHKNLPWLTCGGVWLCSFAKSKVLARSISGHDGDRLGGSLAVIETAGGDLEGRCLAGEPGFDDGRGRLLLLSSATLDRLRTIEGSKPGAGFGAKILLTEVATAMSRVALVSSEPAAAGRSVLQPASIALLSLDDWTILAEHSFTLGEKLGRSGLVWIPDQDEDSRQDIAVGIINGKNSSGATVGRVEIRSGKTLAHIRTIEGREPASEFGASLASLQPRRGESRFELLIGSPGIRDIGESASALMRLDFVTGACRTVVDTFDGESRAGQSVVSLGDVDGDGICDFALGAPGGRIGFDSECGWARVVSGAKRTTIAESIWRPSARSSPDHPRAAFTGFGGRVFAFEIVRKGKSCSILAVGCQPDGWEEGVVFFDTSRIAMSDDLRHAAVWEATFSPFKDFFELRTLRIN